jgi:hypothetical protein
MSTEEKCPECFGHRGLPRMLHDQELPRECSNEFHKTVLASVLEMPSPEPAQERAPQPQSQQAILKPVCPHCGVEGKIAGGMTDLGPFKVIVVRCGNTECRKILGMFQPLGLEMVPPPAVH